MKHQTRREIQNQKMGNQTKSKHSMSKQSRRTNPKTDVGVHKRDQTGQTDRIIAGENGGSTLRFGNKLRSLGRSL